MPSIQRHPGTANLSAAVVHDGRVYVSGTVATIRGDTAAQTRNILEQIDELLVKSGSRRDLLLMVNIWLADIEEFAAMNAVWSSWIPADALPARATVQSRLARPELSVEIAAVAALS